MLGESYSYGTREDARRVLEEKKGNLLQQIDKLKMDRHYTLRRLEEDYQNAIQRCEAECSRDLNQLTPSLRELEHRLNDLIPIASLPPEVLSEIFLTSVAEFWNEYKRTPKSLRNKCFRRPWMTLKHVSQRWQDIVLHTPSLFTTITPQHTSIVDFELEASKTLPIDVLFHPRFSSHAFKNVLRELPRVRSMELALSQSLLEQLDLDKGSSIDAPKLTSLNYELSLRDAFTDGIPLFSRLCTPVLTSLSIETMGSTMGLLTTFIRPTLTTLKLSITLTPLINMLFTTPLLRTLSICITSIQSWPRFAHSPTHAILPHLSSLTLFDNDGGYDILQVLDTIDAPSLTTLDFWMRPTSWCDENTAMFFTEALKNKMCKPALSAAFRPRTIAVKDSYYRDKSPAIYFGVAVWSYTRHLDTPDNLDDWIFESEGGCCFSQRCKNAQHVTEQLLPLFDRSFVARMWIQTDFSVPATRDLWRDHFRSTPNLTALCVYGLGVEKLLRASTDGSEPLLLPGLKTLIMHDLSFDGEEDCSSLSGLVSALRSRQAVNMDSILDKLVLYSQRPREGSMVVDSNTVGKEENVASGGIPQGHIKYLVAAKIAKMVDVGVEYEEEHL